MCLRFFFEWLRQGARMRAMSWWLSVLLGPMQGYCAYWCAYDGTVRRMRARSLRHAVQHAAYDVFEVLSVPVFRNAL